MARSRYQDDVRWFQTAASCGNFQQISVRVEEAFKKKNMNVVTVAIGPQLTSVFALCTLTQKQYESDGGRSNVCDTADANVSLKPNLCKKCWTLL